MPTAYGVLEPCSGSEGVSVPPLDRRLMLTIVVRRVDNPPYVRLPLLTVPGETIAVVMIPALAVRSLAADEVLGVRSSIRAE